MEHTPEISVILPLYQMDDYFDDSIASILNQSYSDFEVLILCDNPTENTKKILEEISKKDSRVIVFYDQGIGFTPSLNKGCRLSKGRFIARMDADDISDPRRFEYQIAFFKENPEIGICGSWMEIIDLCGKSLWKAKLPIDPLLIQWQMIFADCIPHPSVMARKEVLEKLNYYDVFFNVAEDYDLWVRAMEITKLANIPKFLLKYRLHGKNLSIQKQKTIYENNYIIQRRILSGLVPNYNDYDVLLKKWIFSTGEISSKDIFQRKNFLFEIYKYFSIKYNPTNRQKQEMKKYIGFELFSMINQGKNVDIFLCLKYLMLSFCLNPKKIIILATMTNFKKIKNYFTLKVIL